MDIAGLYRIRYQVNALMDLEHLLRSLFPQSIIGKKIYSSSSQNLAPFPIIIGLFQYFTTTPLK